ncbi:MAG: hypothetical protein GEU28_02770 [Dehalococcoidia bacterium]|nr:hypothetical protein [Dehalococcoidia bacterium]
MFRSIDVFLRYFDGLNRRTMRDVAALPQEADGWAPGRGEGENAWGINQIVGHMAATRLYFASAYRDEGWLSPPNPDVSSRDRWLPAIEQSAHDLKGRLSSTPDDWLERKVPMLDSDGTLAGWRILMMLVEHEVHHRSQIDTYAGLNDWEPPQIYERTWEQVTALQASERARQSETGA